MPVKTEFRIWANTWWHNKARSRVFVVTGTYGRRVNGVWQYTEVSFLELGDSEVKMHPYEDVLRIIEDGQWLPYEKK